MPRAEETNEYEWWALSNLPASLTKIHVMDKRRQMYQQKIMKTIFLFTFYTYFFNFYVIGLVLFSLPWKDKCRWIHILQRLESDDQVETNPSESTQSHSRCSKRHIIGHFENFLPKKHLKHTCPKLTVVKLQPWKLGYQVLTHWESCKCQVFCAFFLQNTKDRKAVNITSCWICLNPHFIHS